ncbi:MAG: polyprenyl synthetase family protein [Bacteroidetes bacterium]|nr:MAG: polyprenyl synthetase family protein [Bacteroidota bacterium]
MHTTEELQQRILDLFGTLNYMSDPQELYEPIQYSLSQGGKRLRPLLSFMACSLYGGKIEEVTNAAIGLEIFHNFTLLHDDIMDKSPLRRGMPSVYKKWDLNTAILSGDTMFVVAYEYVTNTKAEYLVDTLKVFNATAREVCEGQQYDMNFETQKITTIDNYMEMIRLKTAVLIAAALKIGAISANASKEEQQRIYDFGILIGLAFQLRDDYLDAFGDQVVFGKPIGNDIVTNKKTYLYLRAYELADAQKTIMLNEAFNINDSSKKVKEVLGIYNELNIRAETENIITKLYDESFDLLQNVDRPEEEKVAFYSFLKKLIKREV